MTAAGVLKAASDAGIAIAIDGADLILRSAAKADAGLVERIRSHKAEIRALLRQPAWFEEDWQALFDERAGIMEYDGGLSRAEAEAGAAEEVETLRREHNG
jgi:hypothetical protein